MEQELPDIRARHTEARKKNLEWANKVRIAQAEMKRRLRDGRIDPVQLLDGYDQTWSRFSREVKIGGLLESIPRIGRSTVRDVLDECGLRSEDRLKYATDEQRERLVALIKMILTRE